MLFTSGLSVGAIRPLLDNNGLAVDARRPSDILYSNIFNARFQTFHNPWFYFSPKF